ncbi:RNA polymerase sigma factor [Micromonospora polyrhachis]|uniref:RNA polymerase sigma-70 factor (ECF subfamily) n=1 Tax=Micromonospora polyrhachis TaxID=1282883 RepID=A0A7W7WNR5_9ACTN|nr:RNA polymerase sigma factor [Micromonospora polyrhachis]MBB4958456.1 RNA polymerase sigma-70 factor (ECF subfamily) [Micromonospora polyrhachis]
MQWIRNRSVPPPTEESGDADLLRAVAGRQVEALRLLHRRHAPWLRSRLARRCADPDVVDAAVQDTFVAIWRGAHRFTETNSDAAAWIWTIAIRRLLSTLRGAGFRWQSTPVPEIPEQSRTAPSAEEVVLLGIQHGDLGGALSRLSPELRAVIQATVLDGLTVREAAALLGVPEGTAKTRLMRAKARLREYLT